MGAHNKILKTSVNILPHTAEARLTAFEELVSPSRLPAKFHVILITEQK